MVSCKHLIICLALICAAASGLWSEEAAAPAAETPVAVRYFIEGLNTRSYATARPYISKDFSIEGVPPEFTQQALAQLFSVFPVTVENQVYRNHRPVTYGAVYTISLMTGGRVVDVDFEVDKEGKVLSCSLFQIQSAQAMAEAQGAGLELVEYAEVEFELVNGIILLPVKLNGEDVKFILDSGAPVLVVNSVPDTTSSQMAVAAAQGIGGSISGTGFTTVQSFAWAGGTNRDFETVSMDLSHLEQELGQPFRGLISKAELEPFETWIDYSTRKLRLYKLKDNGALLEPKRLPKAGSTYKFNLSAHIACLKATVGKRKLILGLDTGAQTNLLDDDYLQDFKPALQEVQTDTLRGADSNQSAISTGILPLTKIGKNSFPDMRYAFSDLSVMKQAYLLKIDGLLGYPFLSSRPFSLNYRKKTLRLY